VSYDLNDGGDANEYVDNSGDRVTEHCDHIPTLSAETDESPIEPPNYKEDERNDVYCFHKLRL